MKRMTTLTTLRHTRGGLLLVGALLLAALPAGCSSENAPDEAGRKSEIRITAEVDGATAGGNTRAIANKASGLAGVTFVKKDGTSAPATWADGTTYTGDVAAATGQVTFSTAAPTYNLNDQNAWFVAYHPGKAPTGGVAEWDIDGKTDIMVTDGVWNAGKYSVPVTTGMRFKHQLARVEVVMKAESVADIAVVRAAWGDIEKIEFVEAPTKMAYDPDATPAVSTSGSVDFKLLKDYDGTEFAAMSIPEKSNTAANAVAMLAPVANSATESFRLRVTAKGDGTTPIVTEQPISLGGSFAAMTAGYTHVVTMVFKAAEKKIVVSASMIDDWGTGHTGSGEMEVVQPIIEYDIPPCSITSGKFYENYYLIPAAVITSYNNRQPGAPYYSSVALVLSGEPPYENFEVATSDEKNAAGSENMNWTDAWYACKNKSTNGTGWRMPRLSELMLIYLNRAELKKMGGFTDFGSACYWSAEESNSSYNWYVNFVGGHTAVTDKTNRYDVRVRCVREL